MKTLLIKDITENFEKESFLNTIKPLVIIVRQQFQEFALMQMPEIGEVVINHFNERLKRANNTLMLGEYAPFILGNLFSVSKLAIEKVAFPWFLMYEYSLLLDDLLDKERENWQLELISSQILLDNSLGKFFVNENKEYNMSKSLNKYRSESISGMVHEIKWSKRDFSECRESSILIQGRKAALVKFCVSYMINIDKNRNITEEDENILDNICAGIQLLDDLTDFIEDHKEGRINLMLSSLYKWILSNYPKFEMGKISDEQLIAGLILSQSLNTTLEISHNLLKSVNQLKKCSSANNGSIEYFNKLADNCLQKSNQIDSIIQSQSRNILTYKNYLFQQNKNCILKDKQIINYVRHQFLNILTYTPRASN